MTLALTEAAGGYIAGRARGPSGHSLAGCLVGDGAVGMHHEKVRNVVGGGGGGAGRARAGGGGAGQGR